MQDIYEKKNEICEKLKSQALLENRNAMVEWRKHAEECDNCRGQIEIIDKLTQAVVP